MALPHWVVVLAVLYLGVGLEILRRALQPTCNNCLYRHKCPLRAEEKFCYSREPGFTLFLTADLRNNRQGDVRGQIG
jgi:hypothetical protein